jgi:hypothetical protein
MVTRDPSVAAVPQGDMGASTLMDTPMIDCQDGLRQTADGSPLPAVDLR